MPARRRTGMTPMLGLALLLGWTQPRDGLADSPPELSPFPVTAGLAAVPDLNSRITDSAGLLAASERDELAALSRDIETRTGAQAAVLMVPSTAPETIEQYGIRVAEAWKLGEKKRDNGVLLLVAVAEHRVRIEVGYGLEGDLPDARARRIIAETIVPRFRHKDYYGGIRAGLAAIAAAITPTGAKP